MKTVIALGFFDGVHLGHAELIKKTKERAAVLSAESAVLTFDAHPDKFVSGSDVKLLTDSEERAEMIRRLFGVENVLFIHFSEEVMRMPWHIFLDSLRDEMGAVGLVAGYDFRFGYKGEGDASRLKEYCAENGMTCDIIPEVKLNGELVSSTNIRKLVESGELFRANAFLGHPHELTDTVRYGHRFGRKIGAPTINLSIPENVVVPKFGVYATKVFFGDEEHIAVTNVGVRPTVGGTDAVSVESYILDFSGNLYGKRVRVEFHAFLRDENKFESVEKLKEQIALDEKAVRKFFDI